MKWYSTIQYSDSKNESNPENNNDSPYSEQDQDSKNKKNDSKNNSSNDDDSPCPHDMLSKKLVISFTPSLHKMKFHTE